MVSAAASTSAPSVARWQAKYRRNLGEPVARRESILAAADAADVTLDDAGDWDAAAVVAGETVDTVDYRDCCAAADVRVVAEARSKRSRLV